MSDLTVEESVKPFKLLYESVDRGLERYLDDHGGLDAQAKQWLEWLIDNFRDEFDAWPSRRHLKPYLNKLRSRSTDPALRLAGHAYLHVAYDMPRVIARSLRTNFPGRTTNQTGSRVPRDAAKLVYLDVASVLIQVVTNYTFDRDDSLLLSALSRIPILPKLVLSAIAHWMVALRTLAFVHGELIYEGAILEASFGQEIPAAMIRAIETTKPSILLRIILIIILPLVAGISFFEIGMTISTGIGVEHLTPSALLALAALLVVVLGISSYFLYAMNLSHALGSEFQKQLMELQVYL